MIAKLIQKLLRMLWIQIQLKKSKTEKYNYKSWKLWRYLRSITNNNVIVNKFCNLFSTISDRLDEAMHTYDWHWPDGLIYPTRCS